MAAEQVFERAVTLRVERRLPVSPGGLFHALTDSAEVTAWMGYPATIGPGLGGSVYVEFGRGAEDALYGVVCGWAPDREFAYTWGDSVVRFHIVTDGGSEPELRVVHTGVSPDLAAGLAAGWHGFLDRLQAHLTGTRRTSEDAQLLEHYRAVYAGFSEA